MELSPEKTRIVHLTEGFDFLGFNVRLYKAPQTARTGWKLLIKPSRDSLTKIREKIRAVWLGFISKNAQAAVQALNPIIRGWANYFRIGVACEAFNRLDFWMFTREFRYARRNHPKKSATWMKERYFGAFNPKRKDNWVFGDKATGMFLLKFGWFKIERHVLVKGYNSPDDGTLRNYWDWRNRKKAKDLKPSRTRLAQSQKGRCVHCGESLFEGEDTELHHKISRAAGGTDKYENLELLHLFCHQQIHQTGMQSFVCK